MHGTQAHAAFTNEFSFVAIVQNIESRAPAKMPPAMVQRMNEDVKKVLGMPDVQEKME